MVPHSHPESARQTNKSPPPGLTLPSTEEKRNLRSGNNLLASHRALAINTTPTPHSMDIAALTAKALELRRLFDERAQATGARPWSREDLMQGFVVDVGALMKLVMAKGGAREVPDVDRKLAHELADCLWSVLVLAESYGVNLETEYLTMIDKVTGSDLPGSLGNR